MNAPVKSNNRVYLLWFAGAVALTGIGVGASISERNKVVKTEAQIAQEKQFDEDLTRAAGFAQMLKKVQKDPDSFKLHSVGITPKGAACIEFSGTNSYGARLRNSAVLSRDGKTALTSADGNKFVNAWNTHCAKQPLSEELASVDRTISRSQ